MTIVAGSWLDYLQLALNATLIALLIVLAFRNKPHKDSQYEDEYKKVEALAQSLADIAKEHEVIAKQFEANLHTKRNLIHELISQLDQRIAEAKKIAERLEQLIDRINDVESSAITGLNNPEHERIIQLANKGFTVQSIAQQVQKSVGEVELVINLYRHRRRNPLKTGRGS
ncbi:MAG: hypothetical protein WHS38_07320 [Thermodesulforhabdaceae bacterium]